MKLLTYIWRNVTRNKVRTFLTIMSMGLSLALMTVLYGYLAMQDFWSESSKVNQRVVVMSTQGFSGEVPIAYIDRITSMKGVVAAVPYSWFGGFYREEQMPFAQFGTDPKHVFDVWSEFKIDPSQLKAWQNNRRGCVVDRGLAERRGWKIGERIQLAGTFYPFSLDLELVGMFDPPQYSDSLWFDWSYLDEQMKQIAGERSGNAGIVYLKVDSIQRMAEMSKEIDAKFASSDKPTRTQTEAAFAQMFADMVGNIRQFILFISAAVVFSLTLVTGNAMAMSMRERTTEIAVLKAIGFTRQRVLAMVLGESTMIAFLGGLLGVSLGCFFLESLHAMSAQYFPVSIKDLVGPWLFAQLAIAGGIGLVSGSLPAVRAAQLSVVNGLRRVI